MAIETATFLLIMVALCVGGAAIEAVLAVRRLRRWLNRSPRRHSGTDGRMTVQPGGWVTVGALRWYAGEGGDHRSLAFGIDGAYSSVTEILASRDSGG